MGITYYIVDRTQIHKASTNS